MYQLAIIGAGASGLFAANLAAMAGISVCVIESADRAGKKLLATGNGKCNVSNQDMDERYYNTSFVTPIICRFDADKCRSVFWELGVVLRNRDGRIYPYSEQASTVQTALREGAKNIITSSGVKEIVRNKRGYTLICDGKNIDAERVILATGSNATCGENSHSLYAKFGHTYSKLRPSLCPLQADSDAIRGLQGIRADVKATIIAGEKYSERGEILFKSNALSGIVSFSLSARLARWGRDKGIVSVDFAPDKSAKELREIIAENKFRYMYHKNIVSLLEKEGAERGDQALAIKDYRIPVRANNDRLSAQVMSGGLNTAEFDRYTLRSLKEKGLYAIGEVLDVDGDCGGYNLHWAWASAYAAIEGIKGEICGIE